MKYLKSMVRESLSLITPKNWLESVRHAEKLQDDDGKINSSNLWLYIYLKIQRKAMSRRL